MEKQDLVHFTFAIERRLEAPPAAVFKAWSDLEAKSKWFAKDDTRKWKETSRTFDFRIGGEERAAGMWDNGTTTEFVALYRDIVENERIVYVYDMFVNGEKFSVSLATIEIENAGSKTVLKVTEQGAHFDGLKGGKAREHGTNYLMDELVKSITG
jgi:uncharacterized protein YndB with AHSA1/START domain